MGYDSFPESAEVPQQWLRREPVELCCFQIMMNKTNISRLWLQHNWKPLRQMMWEFKSHFGISVHLCYFHCLFLFLSCICEHASCQELASTKLKSKSRDKVMINSKSTELSPWIRKLLSNARDFSLNSGVLFCVLEIKCWEKTHVLGIGDEVAKLPSAVGWKLHKAWGSQEELRQIG